MAELLRAPVPQGRFRGEWPGSFSQLGAFEGPAHPGSPRPAGGGIERSIKPPKEKGKKIPRWHSPGCR